MGIMTGSIGWDRLLEKKKEKKTECLPTGQFRRGGFFDIIPRCFNFLFTSISFGSIWFFELIGFLRRSYPSLLDILTTILGVYPFLLPSWWQELCLFPLFFLQRFVRMTFIVFCSFPRGFDPVLFLFWTCPSILSSQLGASVRVLFQFVGRHKTKTCQYLESSGYMRIGGSTGFEVRRQEFSIVPWN